MGLLMLMEYCVNDQFMCQGVEKCFHELFFLGLGIILFGIVGSLSMASIENVPEDLVDNAAVFGALCILTALVFIADLLMSSPKKKISHGMTEALSSKAKNLVTATLSTEKESKPSKSSKSTGKATKSEDGTVNDGFEKAEERHQKSSPEEISEDPRNWERDRPMSQSFKSSGHRDEENGRLSYEESERREHTQNFENGRALRDSARLRSSETQKNGQRDSYKMDHRHDMPKIVYKVQDIYQRPVDEVDTPRFPTEMDARGDAMFAKVVNPGVKIMKVEHDVDETFDSYRYSDTSQYDNVPIRMRGASPNYKKSRDVSFNVPSPPKGYGKAYNKIKDEMEMLEECFGSLRTASTQTAGARTPSSPTDPGYVRHTASNWPQETKMKTPGGSPVHGKN
ncbi:uncharacterized protein LOC116429145 isoform X2 [Nomia melanderi]|uniref:uncharacterized protein LOC116429145 isoform X2 n=1 Tax=Nomia melanderi TaxID=2448451 RepID=UPI0013041C3F|nr:uncharacterized protein LOC116429145 isoform X2 [Nomia melanderi]